MTNLESKIFNKFLDRFVCMPSGCWEWQGNKSNGYAVFYGIPIWSTTRAARISYMIFRGKIPEGLEIDHLCRNRACVNSSHLEAVTHAENIKRRIYIFKKRTHCKKGHPMSKDNVKIDFANKWGYEHRLCRICLRAKRQRMYYRKKLRENNSKGGGKQ